MPELRHEGIGETGKQDRDTGGSPPFSAASDPGLIRKRMRDRLEEAERQEQLHENKRCRKHREQRKEIQPFLQHGNMAGGSKIRLDTECFGKPVDGGCEAAVVVRRKAVVGHEQFDPPGGAVLHGTVRRVPGGLIRCRSEEFRSQIAFEKFIGNGLFIITEVTEFVVFRLQQKHVVKVDAVVVIYVITEKLTALKDRRFGGDILSLFVDGAGIRGSDAPGGPCAHRVPAQTDPGGIDVFHTGKHGVCRDAAAGGIGDRMSFIVLGIMIVEERQVGEVHHDPVAFLTADLDVGPVFLTVVSVIDGDLVIDVTAGKQTRCGEAVSVFIDGHDDDAASCKLDRICGIGLVIVLIAVQQKDRRCGVFRRCAFRSVKLVIQVAGIALDRSFADAYAPHVRLYEMRKKHEEHRTDQQDREEDRHFAFHVIVSGRFNPPELLSFLSWK